jgi:hypothetical protein
MWGPLVLAGDHGPRAEGRAGGQTAQPIPVLVAAERPVTAWVTPVGSRQGDFVAKVGRVPAQPGAAVDVMLTPFYRTHRRRYSVYFDLLTQEEFDARAAVIAAERERQRKIEAATVSFVQPGDTQSERQFNYQSEPADRQPVRTNGRSSRGGPGWFSFDVPVDPNAEMTVLVTHLNELGLDPAAGNFSVQVDGTTVGTFRRNTAASGFFDAQYAIPAQLTAGKSKVTVRFQANGNGRIAPVFGVRMVRGKDI